MTRDEFLALANNKIVILDGATGSNLQASGMPASVCPEEWILAHEDALIRLQTAYLEAGTDIIYAPTFTCNRLKLREYGLEDSLAEMNQGLVRISKKAADAYTKTSKRQVYVAGNLTMTGVMLYPAGSLQFEELVAIYKEQIQALDAAGVDLLIVETMTSLQECRAAVLAAKECSELPVMVTMTFEEDGRTLYGTEPKTAIVVLQSMGAAAVGVNCSTGPDKMEKIIREMKDYANIPIIVKPNAGLPELLDGATVFSMGAEEFADKTVQLVKAGAGIVGGCCGTTPQHIQALAEAVQSQSVPIVNKTRVRTLTTEHKTLEIALDGAFMVIGERINPTGKKALQEELRNNRFDLVCKMAEEQEDYGATILDINMGMNGIDEKEMMVNAIYEVLSVSDLPLSIDSSHIDVIEAALRIYPGRALINSISLEKEKFDKLIPIAKKYGAMFILLPLSDQGLPKDISEKKEIIHMIIDRAIACGLSKEDIIVDGLVNTVGANKDAALSALETIRYCRHELGVATMCGLSNISFGLPERQFVNAAFLSFCMREGMTMAIANPSQTLLMNTVFASDLLLNKPEADTRYIDQISDSKFVIEKTSESARNSTVTKNKESVAIVYADVLKGNKKGITEHVQEELDRGSSASDVLNQMLIPAIQDVGRLFEEKKYYLPQLIASAEAMKTAAEYIQPMLVSAGGGQELGTIVVATVEGDIHDIGKNLVALMLRNYGFQVIDLGKDVKCEDIIQAAIEHQADIIALSALMTTTMVQMETVVKLRDTHQISSKIMIGGAVITQSYCDEIGADGYSKDANEAVKVAKWLVGKE